MDLIAYRPRSLLRLMLDLGRYATLVIVTTAGLLLDVRRGRMRLTLRGCPSPKLFFPRAMSIEREPGDRAGGGQTDRSIRRPTSPRAPCSSPAWGAAKLIRLGAVALIAELELDQELDVGVLDRDADRLPSRQADQPLSAPHVRYI
jgi:hypothetical protein